MPSVNTADHNNAMQHPLDFRSSSRAALFVGNLEKLSMFWNQVSISSLDGAGMSCIWTWLLMGLCGQL